MYAKQEEKNANANNTQICKARAKREKNNNAGTKYRPRIQCNECMQCTMRMRVCSSVNVLFFNLSCVLAVGVYVCFFFLCCSAIFHSALIEKSMWILISAATMFVCCVCFFCFCCALVLHSILNGFFSFCCQTLLGNVGIFLCTSIAASKHCCCCFLLVRLGNPRLHIQLGKAHYRQRLSANAAATAISFLTQAYTVHICWEIQINVLLFNIVPTPAKKKKRKKEEIHSTIRNNLLAWHSL